MREAKQFFFEKKNQKTFFTLGHGRWRPQRLCPPNKPVMPAFAGMTGKGAV
jgi:hypothetical protein